MARKYYRRSFKRSFGKPSYVRDCRIVNSQAWGDHPNLRDCRVLSLRVVYNPTNDRVDPGSIKTVKHLVVQVNTVPYFRYKDNINQTITGIPSIGWVLVYVPDGTTPNYPLGTDASLQNNSLYEPNQFVLGHGTLLQGARIEDPDGLESGAYPAAVSGGNNMRIRCPLNKKLNPGDSIYLLVYALHLPVNGQNFTITTFTGTVSYAIKDN